MNITNTFIDLGMIAIAILLIFLVIKFLAAPIKGLVKFLLHAAMGFGVLLAVNYVGTYFDFFIPITWITALISGLGGIPGVILLILVYLLIL